MPAIRPSSSSGCSGKLSALGLTAAAALGGIRTVSAQTVFTFTPTSDNSISYSDAGETEIYIDVTAGTVSTTSSPTANFGLTIEPSSNIDSPGKALVASPDSAVQNESVATSSTTSPKPYVTPLNAGDTISGTLDSLSGTNPFALSSTTQTPAGSGFTAGGTYYLGFSFNNGSNVDYGWMNITTTNDSAVNSTGPATVTLNSFAYEDGGSGIIAGGGALAAVPEPADTAAVMGGMALVAGSVLMYRRRQDRTSRLVRV